MGKKRIEELAGELEAERSSATKAAETSAAEIVKLQEHICFKESQVWGGAVRYYVGGCITSIGSGIFYQHACDAISHVMSPMIPSPFHSGMFHLMPCL